MESLPPRVLLGGHVSRGSNYPRRGVRPNNGTHPTPR